MGLFLVPTAMEDVERLFIPMAAIREVVSVKRLGEILTEQGMVTPEKVEAAIRRLRAGRMRGFPRIVGSSTPDVRSPGFNGTHADARPPTVWRAARADSWPGKLGTGHRHARGEHMHTTRQCLVISYKKNPAFAGLFSRCQLKPFFYSGESVG